MELWKFVLSGLRASITSQKNGSEDKILGFPRAARTTGYPGPSGQEVWASAIDQVDLHNG
jgi:hypothetical protein